MTKIAMVYFSESLSSDRKHHEVNDMLLRTWSTCYKRSGTSFEPVLLTDGKTKIPSCWRYSHAEVESPEPPSRKDVLNKVGWIKSQAYKTLGKCILMDLDAFLLGNIDHLDGLDAPMAMASDPSKRTYPDWQEVGVEMNAGFMLLNSDRILPMFRELWDSKNEFMRITYFDELIFSAICRSLDGIELGEEYNASWSIGDNDAMKKQSKDPNNKVIHFHGARKGQIPCFRKTHLSVI